MVKFDGYFEVFGICFEAASLYNTIFTCIIYYTASNISCNISATDAPF